MAVICRLMWKNNGFRGTQTSSCLTGFQLPTGPPPQSTIPREVRAQESHCLLGRYRFLITIVLTWDALKRKEETNILAYIETY